MLSTGSIERPIVFGNNDTPGVILSSGAKEYMKIYGVLVGKKTYNFTNNDTAYETAIEFKKNGVNPIILDTRDEFNSEIIEDAKKLNIEIKFNHAVIAAKGYKKVNSASIGKLSKDKKNIEFTENIECDCICVSGFWTPSVHLTSQSGNKLKFNEELDAFVPNKSKQKRNKCGCSKWGV